MSKKQMKTENGKRVFAPKRVSAGGTFFGVIAESFRGAFVGCKLLLHQFRRAYSHSRLRVFLQWISPKNIVMRAKLRREMADFSRYLDLAYSRRKGTLPELQTICVQGAQSLYTEHDASMKSVDVQMMYIGDAQSICVGSQTKSETEKEKKISFFASIVQRMRSSAEDVHVTCNAPGFPESNRKIVQLILLLNGQRVMLMSLMSEWFRGRRHNYIRGVDLDERIRERINQSEWKYASYLRKHYAPIFVTAALLIAMLTLFFSFYTLGTSVMYEGEEIGIVDSRKTVQLVTAKVEETTAETLGREFSLPEDAVLCSTRFTSRKKLQNDEQLQEAFNDQIGLTHLAYSLYINDERIGSTQYEGALEEVLEQLKRMYISEDTLSIEFLEDVQIREEYVPVESVVNLGQIVEQINGTKEGEVSYQIKQGDTWSQIANKHGMTSDQLLALNPGYNINRISIGEEIVISQAVPYMTVVVTERQKYTDALQYDIVYEDDHSMYQGDYRVISKGVYGTCDVVADVTYINGEESERTILSSVVLTEPITEQRAQGTKERPSWLPTGSFRWPTSGRITSYFGYRNTGVRGASTNHKGIDIANARGTSIYAADGGTVIYSGWKTAMGYTIIIDHGNGYETYYEHNSELLVSRGDHVFKGEKIARMGSTGVSSGNHCHFGIKKNGVYVNPLNYLP